jgi:hypothetical protein
LVGEVNEGKKENIVSLLKKLKKRHKLGNKEHSDTNNHRNFFSLKKELLGNKFERSGIF